MTHLRPLVGLLLVLQIGSGYAADQADSPRLSPESHVSLVTILPGDPVYSFAGHSAFRIHDPERGIDRLYNYGTFDFDDPLFIVKFLYGHLRYYLSVNSYRRSLQAYQQQGRPVIEQRLALTRSQRTSLFRFLRTNAKPQNRYYQYNFFFDNCSTRIRDALKEAVGSSVVFGPCPNPNKSFRELLDEHVTDRPFLDLGFDLALGLPADRPPTAREVMFLPKYLMQALEHATVQKEDSTRPLVARTDTVQWIENYNQSGRSTDWPSALGGLFLALVIAWTSRQAARGSRPSGEGDAALFASVGLVGLVLCFLWFGSTYTVTESNLNLAWAWPTHLIAAYFLARSPSVPGLRTYFAVTAGAMALLATGWTFLPQDLHWAVLPVFLAVGIRAGWWAVVPQLTTARSSRPSPIQTNAS